MLFRMLLFFSCDLLPVFLTGAGSLGAVDDVTDPVHHSASDVSDAAVALGHHAAAIRRIPGVVAVRPWQ